MIAGLVSGVASAGVDNDKVESRENSVDVNECVHDGIDFGFLIFFLYFLNFFLFHTRRANR